MSFLPISDYDYSLPEERIARYQLPQRDHSKLLVWRDGAIEETQFFDIARHLPENSLIVCNNTRVIQARLLFQKNTGANIQVFCLQPLSPADYALALGAGKTCRWRCMVGNLKKWKGKETLQKTLTVGNTEIILTAQMLGTEAEAVVIQFSWTGERTTFAQILETAGELPIPPYLHRKTETSDLTSYQTVYSKIKGSVAAPTAGLHFTDEVFASLTQKNIETEELTLHVGAGTFLPVKTENALAHPMHAEMFSVTRSTLMHLMQKTDNIVATGTTTVRTLESLYCIGAALAAGEIVPDSSGIFNVGQWMPYEKNYTIAPQKALQHIIEYLDKNRMTEIRATTQIMIKPPYQFRLTTALITNFHQPKSTLLLLVAAFAGEGWRKIYDYALANNFRFLSYGDSSLLFKQ